MKIKAKIDRVVNAGNVKAIASVSLDGQFVVKNLKVMDGKKGLFVSMPQETFTGKDGQKKCLTCITFAFRSIIVTT